MTTYTWNPTALGSSANWATPADWLPQVVPDSANADAVIPEITSNGTPYLFSITMSGSPYVLNSLTIVDASLSLDTSLSIAAGFTLGVHTELDIAGSLAVGNLENANGSDIQGSGQINVANDFVNNGEIIGEGLTLDVPGLRNNGTLIAGPGTLMVDTTSGSGTFANLSNGTLSQGTYEVQAGGLLDLNVGGVIVTDAASITLDADSFETSTGVGGSGTLITQTLQTIAPSGTLTLRNMVFANINPLTVYGVVQLEGGTLSTPGLTIEQGGTVVVSGTVGVSGTVTGPVTNDGILAVSGGSTVTLNGQIGGTGSIAILSASPLPPTIENIFEPVESDGTVEIATTSPFERTVSFAGWSGELIIDNPNLFSGLVSGFKGTGGLEELGFGRMAPLEVSDTILLKGLSLGAITGVTYNDSTAGGTLTLQESGTAIALDFLGDYTLNNFVLTAGPQALSTSPPSVAITYVTPPTISGTVTGQAVTDQTTIAPFSQVSIADPNAGQTETVTVTLSAAANGALSNLAGGAYDAASGVYTDTGTAAAVTTALNGLVFTPTASTILPGQTLTTGFTISDVDGAGARATDSTTSVIATAATEFAMTDTTTGMASTFAETPYVGPVAGLQWQYITTTSDSLDIAATAPDIFIHTGSGNDAIDLSHVGGTNVVDGSTGSNFLVGGIANDTFFVDDRNATAAIWSTVSGFHSGDAATIWGVTPSDFTLSWADGQGATSYTGLTLHATAAGVPTASLTLVGFTSADMNDGKLTVSYGTTATSDGVPGSTYMYVHAD
jgi:hypothetical protein